ncbi:hypothetical protein OAR97_03205 [Arcobacteraceae bacterium]|nr:hypothetical protein [Arcobacteraceae bacterium]
MSDKFLDENIELAVRKEQALLLDIDLKSDMTQEIIEQEIGIKLETGMRDLKDILNQMDL